MMARDWMTLALRVIGVWLAVLTFAAIVDVLAAVLYLFFLLIRFGGSDFTVTVGRLGLPLLAVLKYGAPAAVLLVFTAQITQRLYVDDSKTP